jgi:hypothetical protein
MVSLVSLTSVLLDKLLAIWRRFSLILSGYVFSSSHLSSKPVFPFFQEKKRNKYSLVCIIISIIKINKCH